MTMKASAADILEAGITIEPEEAVAIAQQLIATYRGGGCAEAVEPPFGPPTPSRVRLADDGSVTCRACATTPAVSEIATLLQALLPPPPVRIPGGLRYAIARAMLDVDVPPFDSLDELSETLARYERGPREQILITLLQRFAASRGLVPAIYGERRRDARATQLRRALREADARLYMHKVAADAAAAPRPARGRSVPSALAGVAAGLLLILAGEFMYKVQHDPALPYAPPAPTVVAEPAPVTSGATPAPASALAARSSIEGAPAPASERTSSVRSPSARRAGGRPVVKRASRPIPRVFPDPGRRDGSRDKVLDRLRLRWLRSVFSRDTNL
jgi:hypothetical protein